ncbi:MAG TPA: hypothetical protein VI911_09470 [Patescibacteria group bacterium]|nr:MAG: hypothetical protein UR43_C0005G0123 [candidate division TM6 bacterium GW2011_GWF2_33_332]HLD91227.1 hypothetical protein [Patescibacteria group bacterium]
MSYTEHLARQLVEEAMKTEQSLILEQLTDLVSRNLLVIESTQPVIIQDCCSNKLTIQKKIKLTLKDKEYILKLEEENKELRSIIKNLTISLTNYKDI